MKVQYISKDFTKGTLAVIDKANEILNEYGRQGYDLTLRQLYYQFVARDLLANKQSEYKRLGSIISDARLAGIIDWSYIVDRTRNLLSNSHWDDPADIIHSVALGYALDKWEGQTYRPEVWIEKDALMGVVSGICEKLDVPHFSCRGYTSQSEMWRAGQRMRGHYLKHRQKPVVIHLGDHDPSGIDMTRDVDERLDMFCGGVRVKRIALNYDQIEQYNPPPNPTKVTDSRAAGYIDKFGYSSWELDALEPQVIERLISEAVAEVRDDVEYDKIKEREDIHMELLKKVSNNWDDVADFVERI